MFHSTSKNNDYDYKKKQENLNVNKNRVTFDNIVPEKHPSQRVAELNEKEEAQLKPIQRHDEDEEPVEKKAAQLQEFRKLSGEEVQMKTTQFFAAEEDEEKIQRKEYKPEKVNRITSYNVCYTKLLRSSGDSRSFFKQ